MATASNVCALDTIVIATYLLHNTILLLGSSLLGYASGLGSSLLSRRLPLDSRSRVDGLELARRSVAGGRTGTLSRHCKDG